MTTAPVVTITDELIADLESYARTDCVIRIEPHDIRALLAERAELKRDAERLDWLIKDGAVVVELKQVGRYHLAWPDVGENQVDCFWTAREAIDAAMQAATDHP
ncbi:MAG: hypothetical protein EXR84_14055 [Gammaproteobacteria bacterium]|nr:hypothetical protein [Gammaproteobacteria bacterium]